MKGKYKVGKSMDSENIFGKMEEFMMECGRMIFNMEEAFMKKME